MIDDDEEDDEDDEDDEDEDDDYDEVLLDLASDGQVTQAHEAAKAARIDRDAEEVEKMRISNEQLRREQERAVLDAIMRKLAFPEMFERQDSVLPAYYETYAWAVENDCFGLKSWLSEQDGIYWISGKAGSGKSTLVKFLASDPRTHQLLHQWRTGNVHIIQCFFWYAGTLMQKSTEGLIRTILHQILQACPQLAKTLFPRDYTRDDPDDHAVIDPSVLHRPEQEPGQAHLLREHSDPSTKRFASQQHRNNQQPLLQALHQARQDTASQPHSEQRPHSSLKNEHLQHMKEAIKRMGQVGTQDADLLNGNHNFCIFIDGLDEFAGDQLELIQLLDELSMSPVVKLCLASRPWNIFRRAYEARCSHLLLEDLTWSDINIYVRGNLDRAKGIADLLSEEFEDQEFESLIQETVNGAEGVFLWVYLVVLSVTRGFAEGDSIATLRQRVASFPNDLYEFFNAILGRVDGFYQPLTAQLLSLACTYVDDSAAAELSWFIDYWLLTKKHITLEEPRSVYTLQPRLYSPTELMSMAKDTQLRISAACKDLIYIKQSRIDELANADMHSPLPKVELLHRTVYDFLRSDGRKEILNNSLPACFRDRLVAHFMNLARAKCGASHESADRFHGLVAYSLSNRWSRLDLDFVCQFDRAEVVIVGQGPKNPLIAAALLAFQDYGRFTEKYVMQGDGAVDSFRERFADGGISSMLNAALGSSPLRSFDLDQINFAILEPIMTLSKYMFGDETIAYGIRAATWQHFFSRSAIWMLTREPGAQGDRMLRESSNLGQKICRTLLRLMQGAGAMWPSDNLQFSSSGRCKDGEQCFRHVWVNYKQRLPDALVAHCESKIRSAIAAPYAHCSKNIRR